MSKSRSQPVNLPSARSLMNPLHFRFSLQCDSDHDSIARENQRLDDNSKIGCFFQQKSCLLQNCDIPVDRSLTMYFQVRPKLRKVFCGELPAGGGKFSKKIG